MVGFITDVGNVRKLNEDCIEFYEDGEKSIYVVADGMGGHNAGEVASKLASTSLISYIKEKFNSNDINRVFIESIKFANEKVYNYSLTSNNLNGMGTTITACLIYKEQVLVANVGDSSCFIIKDGQIRKITRDHSLVQELVDEGTITEAEAKNHPNKNIITRAVGTKEEVVPDIYELSITEFQHMLLCSDGLTNDVTNEELIHLIDLSENYNEFCKRVLELAKSRGARDNISLIIVGGEHYENRNYTRG